MQYKGHEGTTVHRFITERAGQVQRFILRFMTDENAADVAQLLGREHDVVSVARVSVPVRYPEAPVAYLQIAEARR